MKRANPVFCPPKYDVTMWFPKALTDFLAAHPNARDLPRAPVVTKMLAEHYPC